MDTSDSTGKGGNTDKGDVCWRLMSEFRSVLANMVPEEFKPDFHELVTRLCVILKVYSSSDQVHVAHFKLLYTASFCLNSITSRPTGYPLHPPYIPFLSMLGNSFPITVDEA